MGVNQYQSLEVEDSFLRRRRDEMRLFSTLLILWSILYLTQSMNIGRDGEGDPTPIEDTLEDSEADGTDLGRSLGRAASVEQTVVGAGSTKPPTRPFFIKPAAAAAGIPRPPSHDEFANELASLIKKHIERHLDFPTCPSFGLNLNRWRRCQCTSPALFSPEGYGNCNFGASKLDKRVWCYVNRDNGLDPRSVCPDAIASQSNPGWYWSRIACIT